MISKYFFIILLIFLSCEKTEINKHQLEIVKKSRVQSFEYGPYGDYVYGTLD